jgi:hypothetical protein
MGSCELDKLIQKWGILLEDRSTIYCCRRHKVAIKALLTATCREQGKNIYVLHVVSPLHHSHVSGGLKYTTICYATTSVMQKIQAPFSVTYEPSHHLGAFA